MPSLTERLLGMFSTRAKSIDGLVLSPSAAAQGLARFLNSSNPSPHELANENKNWVAACTRAISQSVATMDISVKSLDSDGQEEAIVSHDMLELLDYVNESMTRYDLLEITAANLCIFGNAIWLLDGVSDDGKGKPTAIYPLNPKYIKVKTTEVSKGGIELYEYRIGNTVMQFKPSRVIHFRDTNPDDPYWGEGRLGQAFDSVQADFWARLWAKAFFQNGGKVDSVIEVPTELTPDQAKQLLDVWNAKHQGVARAHKTALIPMGGKLVQNGLTIKDMDFPNLRQVSRDEILALFGVPKSILGIVEDVNRANAEASNYIFAERTIKPMMTKIANVLNEFLMPFYGEGTFVDFADPVPENRIEKIESLKAALGGKPWLSVNEARSMQGLPPIENGDEVMTDFASIPLGAPLKKSVKPSPRTRAIPHSVQKHVERKAKTLGLADQIIKAAEGALKKKSDRDLADEADWKRFQTNISPYIRSTEKRLKGLAADQLKEVLAKLPEAVKGMKSRLDVGDVSVKVVNIDELLDEEESVNIMANALKPIYAELVKKEGEAVLAKLTGAAFDDRDRRVQEGLDRAVGLLSREYTKTTKTRLLDTLEEGLADGESLDDLADRVSDSYKQIEDFRAYSVALTETNRIGNYAGKAAMVQSGVVKTVRWYTSPSDVCEFCQEMSGKVEDINSTFLDKGDSLEAGDGSMTVDYDDVEFPPLHTNCHCFIRPEEISV